MAEAQKYLKPVKEKEVENEIGLSGDKRLALAEKKVKSLQKKLDARDKANAGLMKKIMELQDEIKTKSKERDPNDRYFRMMSGSDDDGIVTERRKIMDEEDEDMSDEEYINYLEEEDEYWEEFFMLEKIEHPEYM